MAIWQELVDDHGFAARYASDRRPGERRDLALDVLACPGCGGRLRVLAFITEAAVARRILDRLGLESSSPPLARAQATPVVPLLEPGATPARHTGPDLAEATAARLGPPG